MEETKGFDKRSATNENYGPSSHDFHSAGWWDLRTKKPMLAQRGTQWQAARGAAGDGFCLHRRRGRGTLHGKISKETCVILHS